MKKAVLFFLFLCIFGNSSTAQTTYDIGFKVLSERNFLTNQGFDKLNEVLSSNNFASLTNAHVTGGYALTFGRKSKKVSFEYAFGGFTAKEYSRAITSSDIAKPAITGRYSKTLMVYKLYETSRWRIRTGGGFSSGKLDFTLADLRPQTNTLSSLVGNPSLSSTLVYSTFIISKFEFLMESNYRTKLINEQKGEFSIGLRLGYGYQYRRRSGDMRWFVANSRNEVKNFPLLIMDNVSVQLNVNMTFNLISPEKIKTKK